MELVVTIAVVGILAVLLLPFLARARERGRAAECLNNLHQLGMAVYVFAQEHDLRLPAAERMPSNPVIVSNALPRICDLLANHVADASRTFACPKDKAGWFEKEGSSYEWNYTLNGQRLDQLLRPGGLLPIQEDPLMYDYENFHKSPKGDTKNALYANGRVSQL